MSRLPSARPIFATSIPERRTPPTLHFELLRDLFPEHLSSWPSRSEATIPEVLCCQTHCSPELPCQPSCFPKTSSLQPPARCRRDGRRCTVPAQMSYLGQPAT